MPLNLTGQPLSTPSAWRVREDESVLCEFHFSATLDVWPVSRWDPPQRSFVLGGYLRTSWSRLSYGARKSSTRPPRGGVAAVQEGARMATSHKHVRRMEPTESHGKRTISKKRTIGFSHKKDRIVTDTQMEFPILPAETSTVLFQKSSIRLVCNWHVHIGHLNIINWKVYRWET